MGIYEVDLEVKARGYAVHQNAVEKIGKKTYVEVPPDWIGRNVICIAGSDIQRIK